MAANVIMQSSLVQSKPSLPAKTLQNPSLSRLSKLSPPSRVGFLAKKGTGIVGKASFSSAVADSSSLVLENKKNNRNPIIVIDNYDSFTYNLCQYMGELGCHFEVYRNDELTVEELKRKNPRGVLISPGPGTPQDSGISLQTVLELGPIVPLFGVCMGLQCIGEAFGGKIVRSPYGVMHGKSSLVYYDEKGEDGLFTGLPNPFEAGRYHSLVIEKDSFPEEALEITAWTEDGLVMAARHKVYKNLQGVQFHPESIITSEGKTIVRNFIKLIERKEAAESQN
ncbi:Anthranilate synthase/para-aminobenzoate synthase, glutamine amidotransferase [Corchorus olitorius]|uniref:anthranilate synthase n=1 Tax=Corchorus olitorius TaxID=93759 RepID=A0A1R3HQH4_9ROSI|nr:Anthranilate synthase/para-aminobenzoate synthase, glutamine amidotransferase [Corchorus olitorius]